MSYELPPLPYKFDALEPTIDRVTMELHHDKHHQAYVDHLNEAVAKEPALQAKSVEELLRDIDAVPEKIREKVRNNAGGHANHQFFWKVIQPGSGAAPAGALAAEIKRVFGDLDQFKAKFIEAGTAHFGSGWVFLVTGKKGDGLEILTLPNQDSVLPIGKPGLLLNDLWEHAYYLKHQNRRPEYLKAWFDVVNWTAVGARLDAVRRGDEKSLEGPAR